MPVCRISRRENLRLGKTRGRAPVPRNRTDWLRARQNSRHAVPAKNASTGSRAMCLFCMPALQPCLWRDAREPQTLVTRYAAEKSE